MSVKTKEDIRTRIRARIRRQASLPYETGHSKRVTVHVG